MCLDRRDPARQIVLPHGRRRSDVTIQPKPDRRIVTTIVDPSTGRVVRLTRPDFDSDTPTAA